MKVPGSDIYELRLTNLTLQQRDDLLRLQEVTGHGHLRDAILEACAFYREYLMGKSGAG